MFHAKPKSNIVYKYSKKIFLFKRLKYPSPNALNMRCFWTPSYNYREFGGYPLTIQSLTSRKRYGQKTYGCSTAEKKHFGSAFQAFYTRTSSSYSKARSSHQRCSIKKGRLRNFVKFTGKHLCQSLFLTKWQDSSLQLY